MLFDFIHSGKKSRKLAHVSFPSDSHSKLFPKLVCYLADTATNICNSTVRNTLSGLIRESVDKDGLASDQGLDMG